MKRHKQSGNIRGFAPQNWDALTAEQQSEWEEYIPTDAPAPVPGSVTPLQMRRALNQLGLRATIEAAVAASSQDVRDAWEFGLEVRRNNPLVTGMAAQLGLTDAQVDEMFIQAAALEV